MTHRIKFAPDFLASFDGSPDHLTHILNRVQEILDSGESLENMATSITYGVGSYDTVISITI